MNFTLSIKQETLRAALLFAGRTDIRFYLNGLCLTNDAIVATDGHRLIKIDKCFEDVSGDMPDNMRCIVPRDLVEQALKLSKSKTLQIVFKVSTQDGKTTVSASVASSSVSSAIVDGSYPDFSRVIPENKSDAIGAGCNLNPDYLVDTVKALAFLGGSKVYAVPLKQNLANIVEAANFWGRETENMYKGNVQENFNSLSFDEKLHYTIERTRQNAAYYRSENVSIVVMPVRV
jgi:DNA polymerase III subunit beta